MAHEHNIHFVNKPRHTNPNDPTDHPGYKEMMSKAPERMAKMSFENDAEKRDYMKRVNANPNNVPGLPAFFPATKIASFLNSTGGDAAYVCDFCGFRAQFRAEKCVRCEADVLVKNLEEKQ